MDKVVILSSGGINSTVAAAAAREQYEPALLHITWGHRAAEPERGAFEHFTSTLKIQNTMVAEVSSLATFGGNARVSRRLSIEHATALDTKTPNTFMVGLMPTLLSLAATWAGAIGAKRIIVGISEDHGVPGPVISDLYPDYREEFLQTFNLMLHYAKPRDLELTVEAPFIDLTKGEVIQLGQRLKVPFEHTWSCYAGGSQPCGQCWPCATRAAAFMRSGIPDPLALEPTNA